jgi:hypothetical protein
VTKAQANAINKMWYGPTPDGSVPDPAVDNGVGTDLTGRRWYGLTRGTSLYVAYFSKLDPRMREILRADKEAGNSLGADMAAVVLQDPTMAGLGFKNLSGDGKRLWKELSYGQLMDLFDRGAHMEPVFAHVGSDNPDLSGFKRRGGKFLSWHGWNDEAIPVQGTMRYYDRVVETMGGLDEVQSFFKLYIVPGGGHMSPQGTSNPDANPPIFAPEQMYELIVDWVENGVEPGRVEITSPDPIRRPITQPIFPYPTKTVYLSGDPGQPSSYASSD